MRNTRSEKQAGSRRRRTALEVEGILERYRHSGQTQRVFAGEEGIGVSSLQYWMRRQRSRVGEKKKAAQTSRREEAPVGASLSLLEVELRGGTGTERPTAGRFEIEWPGGTCLRFDAGFAESEVRGLVRLLRKEAD